MLTIDLNIAVILIFRARSTSSRKRLVTIRLLYNHFSAHLLQVTAIESDFGERMVLDKPIPAGMDSQTWLKILEKSMKTTLMMKFTKCLINAMSRAKDETVVSDFLEKGT